MNIKAGGVMNVKGSPTNINASASSAASAAQAATPSLITLTDYEYFTRTSGS